MEPPGGSCWASVAFVGHRRDFHRRSPERARTVTKIDLIPLGTSPFDRSEFSRRTQVEVRPGATVFLKQPEDTVLRKLLWFRDGGGVSERQWRDVVGVLRHSRAQIDAGYMAQWAATLALGELLDAARREANSG